MDVVLKELFGESSGQEVDFIAKSLFERQDQEQLGSLSIEHWVFIQLPCCICRKEPSTSG